MASQFEIVADTTQSILVWIEGQHREVTLSELGQAEIGRRINDAINRAREYFLTDKQADAPDGEPVIAADHPDKCRKCDKFRKGGSTYCHACRRVFWFPPVPDAAPVIDVLNDSGWTRHTAPISPATGPHPLADLESEPVAQPVHRYLSTYCFHALHLQCRRTCKTCEAACICSCRYEGADKPSDDCKTVAQQVAACSAEQCVRSRWPGEQQCCMYCLSSKGMVHTLVCDGRRGRDTSRPHSEPGAAPGADPGLLRLLALCGWDEDDPRRPALCPRALLTDATHSFQPAKVAEVQSAVESCCKNCRGRKQLCATCWCHPADDTIATHQPAKVETQRVHIEMCPDCVQDSYGRIYPCRIHRTPQPAKVSTPEPTKEVACAVLDGNSICGQPESAWQHNSCDAICATSTYCGHHRFVALRSNDGDTVPVSALPPRSEPTKWKVGDEAIWRGQRVLLHRWWGATGKRLIEFAGNLDAPRVFVPESELSPIPASEEGV